MDNKPLLRATITIDEIIEKGNRISVKPTAGPKFSFFKTKQDGTESMAYRQMQDMELKSGMTVNIGYDETPGDFQGKAITYRNIKHFSEAAIQVQNEPNFDQIREQKSKEIKEAQEIRKAEFDKLIFAIDNLTNKIDQLIEKIGKDTSTIANVNGNDINVDDLPFD